MFTFGHPKGIAGLLIFGVVMSGVLRAEEKVGPIDPKEDVERENVKETGNSSAEALPLGKIIRRVITHHDKKQSYALYLPNSYAPQKKWPILYAFSPMANGRTPVHIFRDAAEKYGWIVVGSNTSRNGMPQAANDAMQAMWKDTHARFSIDENRLYATGFSGGARVSFRFAYNRKTFAGVIPCGASFPSGQMGAQLPPKNSPMLVCGIGGNKGFNYFEMLRMKNSLAAQNVRHRLLVFDGDHRWPPSSVAERAVRYMELSARLTSGRGAEEETLAMLAEERETAEQLLKTPSTAYEGYLSIKDWLPLLKGSDAFDAFQARVEALKNSDQMVAERAAKKALAKLHSKLRTIVDQVEQLKVTVKELNTFKDAYGGTQASELVKIQLMELPRRMLGGGYQLMVRGEYVRALGFLKGAEFLSTSIKDPAYLQQAKYLMALAFAQTGKPVEACAALGKAVELGYADVEKLKKHKLLEPIKGEEAFKNIILGMETIASKEGSEDSEKKGN